MMRELRIIPLTAAMLLWTGQLVGECAPLLYLIEGSIQPPTTANARIYLFLADRTEAGDYHLLPGESDYMRPKPDGRFAVSALFDTYIRDSYSSKTGHEDCSGVASIGTLMIVSDNMRVRRHAVSFERTAVRNGKVSIELPVIVLSSLPQPSPVSTRISN